MSKELIKIELAHFILLLVAIFLFFQLSPGACLLLSALIYVVQKGKLKELGIYD